MQWKDKQYWYFITEKDMGSTMTLHPRTPWGCSEDEPTTKRICVAPTAAHCMSAIDIGSSYRANVDGNVYVYRTRRQVKARVPYSVYDSHITQEHWLHTSTRFTLVDVLQLKKELKWSRLKWDEADQRKDLQAIKSWCKRRAPELVVKQHANKLWRSPRAVSVNTIKEKTKVTIGHTGFAILDTNWKTDSKAQAEFFSFDFKV